jgi:hypothetical protein
VGGVVVHHHKELWDRYMAEQLEKAPKVKTRIEEMFDEED